LDETKQPSVVDMGDNILKSSSSDDTNANANGASLQAYLSEKPPANKKRRATGLGKKQKASSSSAGRERKISQKKRPPDESNADRKTSSKRGRDKPREAGESRTPADPALKMSSSRKAHDDLQISQSTAHLDILSQRQQQDQLAQLLRPSVSASLNMPQPPALTAAEQIILMSTQQRRPTSVPQIVDYQQLQQLQLLLQLQQLQQQQQQQQQLQQHVQVNSRAVASLAHMPFNTGEGGNLVGGQGGQGGFPVNVNPFSANLAAFDGVSSRASLESAVASLSHANRPTNRGLGRYDEELIDFGGRGGPSMELLASLQPAAAVLGNHPHDTVSAEIPVTPQNPELEWRSAQLCQQAKEFIEVWKASQDAETLEELKEEGRWNRKRKSPSKKKR
jgi:hypothetical protein